MRDGSSGFAAHRRIYEGFGDSKILLKDRVEMNALIRQL
jgi:hypothetical protein